MSTKTKRVRRVKPAKATIAKVAVTQVAPAIGYDPGPVTKPRRRRRRRRAILADRTIAAIRQKEREFLREVGAMLTSAIGFPVRVSRVKLEDPASPEMRKAQRMTKAKVRQQLKDAFAPLDRIAAA